MQMFEEVFKSRGIKELWVWRVWCCRFCVFALLQKKNRQCWTSHACKINMHFLLFNNHYSHLPPSVTQWWTVSISASFFTEHSPKGYMPLKGLRWGNVMQMLYAKIRFPFIVIYVFSPHKRYPERGKQYRTCWWLDSWGSSIQSFVCIIISEGRWHSMNKMHPANCCQVKMPAGLLLCLYVQNTDNIQYV